MPTVPFEAEAYAKEQAEQAAFAASGVKRVRIHVWETKDLYGMSDWHKHPDGTFQFMNAFFSRRRISDKHHDSNFSKSAFVEHGALRPAGDLRVFLDIFPTHYEINGEKIERGKLHVQLADGSVAPVELTPGELDQFQRSQLAEYESSTSNAGLFMKTDLYLHKIAPLLGPVVAETTPQAP